jgi:pyrrolysine biosynthesis protein PylC
LQGTEAAYLAREAGYEVVLVDRVADVPATGLVDEFHLFDVTADEARARRLLSSCDAVLPACEDRGTLQWLDKRLADWGVPFVFHLPSYAVSSSKLRSDRLFAEIGLPRPLPWPECGYPVVVKPSGSSGSEGITVAGCAADLSRARAALGAAGHDVVVQEFVEGPSLSLEVIAAGGDIEVLVPTSLEFGADYDCMRVVAPAEADPRTIAALHDAGRRIAGHMGLHGLMDLEVMVQGLVPKVIEIDARLPSQTPTAVYHACDLNMVALMVEACVGGRLPAVDRTPRRAAVYQHVSASAGGLEVVGEHALATACPLRRVEGFYGAHVALTDGPRPGKEWVATIVTRGRDAAEARREAAGVLEAMADDLGLRLMEPSPSRPRALRCGAGDSGRSRARRPL